MSNGTGFRYGEKPTGTMSEIPRDHSAQSRPFRRTSNRESRVCQRAWIVAQVLLFASVVVLFIFTYRDYGTATTPSTLQADEFHSRRVLQSTSLPDYYQTSPELFPGMSRIESHGYKRLTLERSNSHWTSCVPRRNQASFHRNGEYTEYTMPGRRTLS